MSEAEKEIERVAKSEDPTIHEITAAIWGLIRENEAIAEAATATKH